MSEKNNLAIIPEQLSEVDADVPNFLDASNIRNPESRNIDPSHEFEDADQRLYGSAINRILYAGGISQKIPPVHFPNGEHVQHYHFDQGDWNVYGNMESEKARIDFMLEKHPERGFPIYFMKVISEVDFERNTLEHWQERIPQIDSLRSDIYQGMKADHIARRKHADFSNGFSGAFFSEPEQYYFHHDVNDREQILWQRSQNEIVEAMEKGEASPDMIRSFLHLHAHVKDPISPIVDFMDTQQEVFERMMQELSDHLQSADLNPSQKAAMVVQMALESSFISQAQAAGVDSIGYLGHHELPYAYIDLFKLPRGEFANPRRVVEITKEIIEDANKYGEAFINPITVSYYQVPNSRAELFIVDGNNRSTSVLVMKYLDSINLDEGMMLDENCIRQFIDIHNLDIEWERDLVMSLQEIESSEETMDMLRQNAHYIKQYANALIPAHFVQEPNFMTVAVAKSEEEGRVVLLQPVHQAIYNERRVNLAIPSKKQSHGRSKGNNRLMVVRQKPAA